MKFQKQSRQLNLDAGVYFYCNCAQSSQFPFCDGSHKDTAFLPKKFRVSEPASVSICMCGQSAAKPYCDGSHRQ